MDRQGLLHVGDIIGEVNGIVVRSAEQLQVTQCPRYSLQLTRWGHSTFIYVIIFCIYKLFSIQLKEKQFHLQKQYTK